MDWITRCIEEDQRVNIESYRIAIPLNASVDVEMAAEKGPAPSTEERVEQNAQLPTLGSHLPLVRAQAPNARSLSVTTTARPSLPRYRTATRADIKTEDSEDNDDCVMLEAPPPQSNTEPTRPTRGRCLPTPPSTPSSESLLQGSTMPQASVFTMSVETESDDDDDEVPVQSTRKLYQEDPRTTDPAPRLIVDPMERESMVRNLVQPNYQHPFEQLEQAFIRWGEQNFEGTFKAFYERMAEEVSCVSTGRGFDAYVRSSVDLGHGKASFETIACSSIRWHLDFMRKVIRKGGDQKGSSIRGYRDDKSSIAMHVMYAGMKPE
jgi:hypothetical protein